MDKDIIKIRWTANQRKKKETTKSKWKKKNSEQEDNVLEGDEKKFWKPSK